MFINEFHSKLMSGKETSRLFDALRRLKKLDMGVFLATGEQPGWPEWPPLDASESGLRFQKA
jgi:hypothetical protein